MHHRVAHLYSRGLFEPLLNLAIAVKPILLLKSGLQFLFRFNRNMPFSASFPLSRKHLSHASLSVFAKPPFKRDSVAS
ncbi:hypothetical protein [Leptothermofonsia sp. ETS-13]|uniref:hypothetical protein n=1 Tax=Leptothermofonsia sp. ETS-13 TaxID=3035696 RepID=UPI003BA10CA0